MPKFIKNALKSLAILFFLLTIYVGGALIFGTLTDFQPKAVIPLKAEQTSKLTAVEDSILSFVSWNIGYGGLGTESNFFLDSHGKYFACDKMVRAPREYVEKNVAGILRFATTFPSDFYLFQEVDYHSKRSYFMDEFEKIKKALPKFSAWFSVNYKSDWIPIPVFEPWKGYGEVFSGLATFARFQPTQSTRFQLPGEYGWPTRIFQLDRCAAMHRFAVKNGRELVVINIHNSAYDVDGILKKQQMDFLKQMVLGEYQKGNYVLLGGDWNMCPPNFPADHFMPGKGQDYRQLNIDSDFLPASWQWAYDPSTPTNRKLTDVYQPSKTFVTLIDFFLVSPNIKVLKINGIDMGFRFSDHQPVRVEVKLLSEKEEVE